jgi:hypothetical protein
MARRLLGITLQDLRIAKISQFKKEPICQRELQLYLDALSRDPNPEKLPTFFEKTLEDAMEAAVSYFIRYTMHCFVSETYLIHRELARKSFLLSTT